MTATIVDFPKRTPEGLVTKQELARRLDLSPRRIQQLAREGLPVHGRDRRGRNQYDVAAVETWLEDRAKPTQKRARTRDVLDDHEQRLRALEARLRRAAS